MIGVLIASKEEFKVLLEVYNIGDNSLEKYPYGEYYRTSFHNRDIVFFRSGKRKTMASGSVQYIIDKFDIKELYVLGTATSSSELLQYQDVFIPEYVVDYDFIIREVDGDIKEEYLIKNNIPTISLDYKTGILGSSDRALVTWKDLTYLASQNIDASDMGSTAILKICNLNNIKCTIIKGITDKPIKGPNGFDEQVDVYEYNVKIVMKNLIENYLSEVI